MAYGSVAGVEAIVPSIAPVTSLSIPTDGQVTTWLAEASAIIDATLGGAGYVTPASGSAAIYPLLTALENLYGAAYALRSLGVDLVSGDQQTTSEVYLEDFFNRLKMLMKGDLTSSGLTLVPQASRRRGVRSVQLRRVDGYSEAYEGTFSEPGVPHE